MQNLLTELTNLLAQDERITSEGSLLKNKVIELALGMDAHLIKLLLNNKSIKKHFFVEIDGILVFDKIKFQHFVSNKEFLPDSYTAFKNKIGLVNENGDYISESKEVVLAWPYKDCVLEGGQMKEEQKRDEIFWNETLAPNEIDRLLAPKVLTNFKRYDKDGEHSLSGKDIIDFSKENLIIKGNNLFALHSLCKCFAGKVKVIYIDPPYNTGNDEFGYNDTFNHSTWLTFIRNRLLCAKVMLEKGGSLWVNIGDEEAHYLKVLLDEIFPKGFVANVVWQKRTSPDARKPLGDAHDYILVYSNDERIFRSKCRPIPLTEEQKATFKNPDNDPKGPWVSTDFTAQGYRPNQMYKITTPSGKTYEPPPRKCWSKIESEYFKLLKEGGMWFGASGDAMPRKKTYLYETEGITSWTWWENKEVGHNQESKQESIALFGDNQPFSTPKPERLIKRIIDICSYEGDLILDFFAGSGTTAAVAAKMNRKYIAVEQMIYPIDYIKNRMQKVIAGEQGGISKRVGWQGGGSFVCCELMQHNEAYIERIQNAKTTKNLLTIWNEMQEKAFISYKLEPKAINENISGYEKLSLDEQKRFLIEILDKNQLYVNYSEIDDKDYGISETDKKLNRKFYEEA
jgi:adenine-specific DNA-methyltransferase